MRSNKNSRSKLSSRDSITMRSSFTPALREDLQILVKGQKKEQGNADAINHGNKSSAASATTTAHCTPLDDSKQTTPLLCTSGQFRNRQSSKQLDAMSYEQLTRHLRDVSLVLEQRLTNDALNGGCRSGTDQDGTTEATSTDPGTPCQCFSSKSERAYNLSASIEYQNTFENNNEGSDDDADDERSGSAIESGGSDLSSGSSKRLRSMSVGNEPRCIGQLRPSFVRCEQEEPEEPELLFADLTLPQTVTSSLIFMQPHLNKFINADEIEADTFLQRRTPSEAQLSALRVTRDETQTPLPWTTAGVSHCNGRDTTSIVFPSSAATGHIPAPVTRDRSLDLTLHSISSSRSDSTSGFDFDGPYAYSCAMPMTNSPTNHSLLHTPRLSPHPYPSDLVCHPAACGVRPAQVSPSSACPFDVLDSTVVGASKSRWTHPHCSGSAFVDIFNLNTSPNSNSSSQPSAVRTSTQMFVTEPSASTSANTSHHQNYGASEPPPQFPQVFTHFPHTSSPSSRDHTSPCSH